MSSGHDDNESRNGAAAPVPADRSGSELLAFLVHDLRNLIAPASNAVHLLRRRATTDSTLLSLVDVIDRQLSGMVRLLEVAVDASRVVRGDIALDIDTHDLSESLTAALDAARNAGWSRSVLLRLALLPEKVAIRADRQWLLRALTLLLDCVGRRAAEGTSIVVEASRHGSEACIRLCYEGTAIHGDSLAGVGSSSLGLEERKRALDLRLAVASSLIALHAGRVEITSRNGGLSHELALWLPCMGTPAVTIDVSETTTAAAESSWERSTTTDPMSVADGHLLSSASRASGRILIADDSDAVRAALGALLIDLGYTVETAANGARALDLAQHWTPDFVLIDVHMPDLNGFVVARRLRAGFPASAMKLVMMSGTTIDETLRRGARDAGFDYCIDKVFSLATLRAVLSGEAVPLGELRSRKARR